MQFKKSYLVLVLLLFFVALASYVSFSTRVVFHDTPEYFTVTKDLAGFGNTGVYSTHSFVYSLFTSFFVKLLPGFLVIKLVNVFWLFLDTLLIFFFFKDKRVFLLWVFSPLVWLVSVQYSPLLPASFFFLLMYLCFFRWEETGKRSYFVVAGLSAGMTFALYEPSIAILAIFIISFFYKKPFLTAVLFLLLALPTFSLRLLTDYFLTGFPFYSLVRYFGTNIAVVLGLNEGTKGFLHGLSSPTTLYSLFLIAPLIFLFYRVNFSKDKRLILFVLVSSLFLFVRSAYAKYFLLTAPLIFVLLAKVMTKKLIVVNSVVSLVLIALFSQGYFAPDPSNVIAGDMEVVSEDYPSVHYIDAADVSLYLWDGNYRFYVIYEYLDAVGKVPFSDYEVVVQNRRVGLYQVLELKAALKPTYKDDILTSPLVVRKGDSPLEGFKLGRCYEYLCVYTR